MVTALVQALSDLGVLRGVAVPGWLGRLLHLAQVDPAQFGPAGGAVSLPTGTIPGIDAAFDLRVSGGATHATFVVALDRLRLDWGAGHLQGHAGATLSVSVDGAGQVTCRVTGDGKLALSGPPPTFHGPGTSLVTMRLSDVAVLPEPAVALSGTLALTGVPGQPREVPFSLRWGTSGLSGSAQGVTGRTAYVVSWSGHHDLRPSTLMLDMPLDADTVPGVTTTGRLRLTGSADDATGMSLRVEVVATDAGVAESRDPAVVTAATLLAACAGAGAGQDGLTNTAAVTAAGAALGAALSPSGRCRVTRASIDLDHPTSAVIDYVTELSPDFDAGFLACEATSPMRASVRGLRVDWSAAPVLDWRSATIELADPGQWHVTRPSGLLQIDRVRSGTGSQWFELDLRFALDLGPVEVERATLRVELRNGSLHVGVRGFGVSVTVPGLAGGSGSVSFTEPGGAFHAALRVDLLPLNLSAAAALELALVDDPAGRFSSLLARLGVDLPAPVPLASTGLGLFGVEGVIGLNRDSGFGGTLEERLSWEPSRAKPARGKSTFGLSVALGTLPDLGHGFSAVGRLAVTTPQLAVVAAVAARILGGRPSVLDPPSSSGPRLRGVLAIIPGTEVSLAVVSDYEFPTDTDWHLFSAQAPVEARWTVANPSDWYVHLGTDRSRPPGPIGAIVLPELMPDLLRAEAFLMVHGNGITGLPVHTSTRGLVVAAGVDVSARMVSFPASAELHARGVVAVSTRPLFLAGRAEVGGALSLGPFRLGIDAGLDLQIGPGATYAAKVRICGEIDLWLFEISGCVSVSIGNQQRPDPDPPESPVESITVCDHRGSAIRAATGGLPVCWPDATVQIGFTPAPLVPNPAMGRFRINPAPYPRSGVIEEGSYRADYRLTGLDLSRVAGPTLATLPSNLPATWQTKPGQAAVAADGAAVLSLLTHDNALWTGHLVDGGAGDVSDLPGARRRECRGEPWPAWPGWADGGAAQPRGSGRWFLPPRQRSGPATSLESVVAARTSTEWPALPRWGRVEAVAGNRALLPVGALAVPGAVISEGLHDFEGELLPGWLTLPDIEWNVRPEEPDPVVSTLVLRDPISREGSLLLLLDERRLDEVRVSSHHEDGSTFEWDLVDRTDGPAGAVLTLWQAPDAFTDVLVRHPLRLLEDELLDEGDRRGGRHHGVGVVALGGVTARASDRATAVEQGKPFTHPTPLPPRTPPPAFVPPLSPAVTYDVRVDWSADATTTGAAAHAEGSGSQRFKVAAASPTRPAAHVLHTATDVFHPAMLARYLRGYRPDGSAPWFTDDPVAAVLERSGITVAHAYALAPTLVVTHTDEPGPVPVDHRQLLAETVSLLRPAELALLAMMGSIGCALPHGPVLLAGDAPLLPDRAYDLTVAFPRADGSEFDAGRLPPVAFRTSHWSGPAELFAEAGFAPSGGSATGSPRLRAVPGPLGVGVAEASDGALASALGGLAGDVLDRSVRTTLLVCPDPGGTTQPAVAGVLVECTEPMRRGPSLENIWMGAFSGADWRRISDRPGTAALFVPHAPLVNPRVMLRWRAWGVDVRAELVRPVMTSLQTSMALVAVST